MQKFIRHKITGAYFSAGKWVPDWRCADTFKKYEDVEKCVRQHHLTNVELHYLYGNAPTRYDWAIPLA